MGTPVAPPCGGWWQDGHRHIAISSGLCHPKHCPRHRHVPLPVPMSVPSLIVPMSVPFLTVHVSAVSPPVPVSVPPLTVTMSVPSLPVPVSVPSPPVPTVPPTPPVPACCHLAQVQGSNSTGLRLGGDRDTWGPGSPSLVALTTRHSRTSGHQLPGTGTAGHLLSPCSGHCHLSCRAPRMWRAARARCRSPLSPGGRMRSPRRRRSAPCAGTVPMATTSMS